MEDQNEFKAFLERIDRVNVLINQADALFLELSTHKAESIPKEGGSSTADPQSAIYTLMQSFQSVLGLIEEHIKQLRTDQRKDVSPTAYLQSVHIKGVAERAQKLVEAFHQEEQTIVEKEQERLVSLYQIAKPNATQEELDLLETTSRGQALIAAAFSVGDSTHHKLIHEATARHANITTLLRNLKDLYKATEQLNQIISQTDESINTISYSLHASSHKSYATNQHIQTGIKRRKRKRTLKLVFVVIVSSIFIFVLLWVAIKLKKIFSSAA
ncbi:hypothetical protein NECID01_0416 [Nematocida sp. AWRm77]|nr:hypothetical protein NECID01_0416 [Nematocida sp. AWRm77]